jgi:hypothetical protein
VTRLIPPSPITHDAEFVEGGLQRIWLSRKVAETGPVGLIIGLNPSKAGAALEDTDHTITKELEYARRWGWSGFWKGNLFTHIETYSAKLRELDFNSCVGIYGDTVLQNMIQQAPEIVVCWGANVPVAKRHRIQQVCSMIRTRKRADARVLCFGLSNGGHPVHPLMLSYDTPLVPFELPAERVGRRDE